ncbi:MAG: hydantoinase/oxoprolinase family protein, partial [Acetobacteraceae bacterium]
VVGWDVGGAHLKAACVASGRVIDVVQVPCPLWLGLDRLTSALTEVSARLGPADRHGATMTGELADIFATRAEGVCVLADVLARHVAPAPLSLYAGRAGWLPVAAAVGHIDDIASANWHASAALAARHAPDGLFCDMGSTTTDIVPVQGGVVRAAGYTDAERLACGELVYTGLTRSFVMALGPRAPMAGVWTTLACEYFANTADVYRILCELPEHADQLPAADHREKTVAASITRLARMVGRDASGSDEAGWHTLAAWLAEQQIRQIVDWAFLVLSRGTIPAGAPVIGAGVGRHVIARVAERIGRRHVDFAELIGAGAEPGWMAACAPAVAIALLASR